MRRQINALVTVWLIVQILLPFTAPFPVCDLTDFFNGNPQHSPSTLPASSTARQAAVPYESAPPLITTAGRLRLVVVRAIDAFDIVAPAPLITIGRVALILDPDQPRKSDHSVLRL